MGLAIPRPLIAAAMLLLVLSPVTTAAALRIDAERLDEGPIEVEAKRGVLVEEVTGTWCSVCAEVDPHLAEVADRHGPRLVLVALHPNVGEDGVSTAAADARLDRWTAVHGRIDSTPSFIVEGEAPLVGREAWSDVTRRILSIEGDRVTAEGIALRLDIAQNRLDVTAPAPREGYQTTVMLLRHDATAREGAVEVDAGSTYARVLTELHIQNETGAWASTCEGTCLLSPAPEGHFTSALEASMQFSVILVHEVADGLVASTASTLSEGVVELAVRPSAVASADAYRELLIGCFLLAGVAAVVLPLWPSNQSKELDEEE